VKAEIIVKTAREIATPEPVRFASVGGSSSGNLGGWQSRGH